jgi:hypothetical protein
VAGFVVVGTTNRTTFCGTPRRLVGSSASSLRGNGGVSFATDIIFGLAKIDDKWFVQSSVVGNGDEDE